jgi:hypothetical protein
MRKLTDRKIKRLLSTGGTPEPPPGLAERIKAEIPEVLQTGAGRGPEWARGFPPRPNVLRPLWLVAASVLLMIGAGFMVAHLLAPPEDLARRIALDGVTVIKDVVVTVPARAATERKKTAKEAPSRPVQAADMRPAAPLAFSAAPGRAHNAPRPTPVRGGGGKIPAALQEKQAIAGIATAGEHETVSSENTGAAGVVQHRDEMAVAFAPVAKAGFKGQVVATAAPPTRVVNGSIVVTVHDADGKPLEGATVMLAFTDRPDVGCGFRITGRAGVATFCCVRPHNYRMCAQLRGFLPAGRDEIEVSSGRQIDVEITMVRPPADGKEHAWTCPPPGPSGTH